MESRRPRHEAATLAPRDAGRGPEVLARLRGLEAATEVAADRLRSGDWHLAVAAWNGVALAAEGLFGPDDLTVVDAMRVAATAMARVGRHAECTDVLSDAFERTVRREGTASERSMVVRGELEVALDRSIRSEPDRVAG